MLVSPLEAAVFACSGASAGLLRLSFTLVLRTCVLSRNGGEEMEVKPRQISAHELMKCQVEVPSRTAWLKAQPIDSPSLSLVSCDQF